MVYHVKHAALPYDTAICGFRCCSISVNEPLQLFHRGLDNLDRCRVIISKCGKFWLRLHIRKWAKEIQDNSMERYTRLSQNQSLGKYRISY